MAADKWRSCEKFMARHRFSVRAILLVLIVMAAAGAVMFDFDIFIEEGHAEVPSKIELDEALLLGCLLATLLLMLVVWRFIERRGEARRRVLADHRLRELAFQDPLTGLANRRQLDESLQRAIDAPPHEGGVHALFVIDLNGFKQINDYRGHTVGDELLQIVAQRMLAAVREGDLVGRPGGDEFAVIALHLMGPEVATGIALRIIQELDRPVAIGGLVLEISAGIGIALIPRDANTRDETIRRADVALYRAKAERRSALRFFEQEMDESVRERAAIEEALRQAVELGEIEPVFLPSIEFSTGRVLGFEVSPHWLHPLLGEVAPERFLPIAQEIGLIHRLGAQLLTRACAVAAHWPAEVTLSIDLFPGQLTDRNFEQGVLAILHETGVAPHRLELEITESTLVNHMPQVQQSLGGLREHGVRIALDNFGTGYSSLYHLRSFKVDKVKIDRSFIGAMAHESESATIVNALVGLGKGLGIALAAEGVDDEQQQQLLAGSGCQQGQGHLYSRPVIGFDTLAMVAANPTGLDTSAPSVAAAREPVN